MPASTFSIRVLRWLTLVFVTHGLVAISRLAADESASPNVALAPIVRADSDASPGESESLTPLLQASLSDDPRWRMVERAKLGALEAEWALSRGGFADAAKALREIRPLGASLLLICRPEAGDLTKPSAVCEVVDVLTAEPLAATRADLSDRPFARWYRNPPAEDVRAIVAAFQEALPRALAVRAAQADRRLVTPLFFTGPTDRSAALESALAAAVERSPTWRLRRSLRLDGSLAETLLTATGFSSGETAADANSGVYLWGRIEPAGSDNSSSSLRYWTWDGRGAPTEKSATGDAPALAAALLAAASAPDANPARSPEEVEQTRLRLAREMLETARSLARSTGLTHDRFFSRLPKHMQLEPLRAEVMRLLASAAFLAPFDPEAQELWLRIAFQREVALGVTWREDSPPFSDRPMSAEARRLYRELGSFADAFWRRPDGSLDLRLLSIAQSRDPSRLKPPGGLAELRRLAGIIGAPPAEELAPHLPLLASWLRVLRDTCPEYQNREAKFEAAFRSSSPRPPSFDSPPDETIQTLETLWPLLRVLRHYPRHYPLNLSFFYAPNSPRQRELLNDKVQIGPLPVPQPRILNSVAPALLETPPPPAPPPLEPVVEAPDPNVVRRVNERRAFFESIKDKSPAEQSRLREAFLQKQLTESGVLDRLRKPAPPPTPAAPKTVPPVTEISGIPSLLPLQRLAFLSKAAALPDQLEVIRALLAAGADPLGAPSDKRPPLLIAIDARQEAYVHAMLDARPDLQRRWPEDNTYGPSGVYLAHAALQKGMPAVANRIIDLHPEQMKGSRGRGSDTLLGTAIKHGDATLVRRLVTLGARCDSVVDDPLINLAMRCARPDEQPAGNRLPFAYVRDMVRLLRDINPESINALEDDGRSPLLIAVTARHYELVEELIAAGASLKRGWSFDKSIPDLAATDPVMQRLLRGEPLARARSANRAGSGTDGADVVADIARRGTAALAGLKLTPGLLAYQDAKKWTLLHHALHLKDETQALRLVAAGAPLEAASIRGQTPLTFAVFSEMPRVVDALLARGANPSGRENDEAISPLRAATIRQNIALMRRLIEAGADLDQIVYEDRVPLLCAAIWNGQTLDTIQVLVEAGARLDRTNLAGYGPLEHAIGKNRVDVLEYLRGKGAPWSKPVDNPEHTPLRFAVRNKARDAILFLLREGERDPGALALATEPDIRALLSDAMQQDAGGKAFSDEELWPAICQDRERWKERVDAHLASGGDVNHGSMDWTPLMLAIHSGNVDLVRHLLAKGANPKIHHLRARNKAAYDLSDVGTLRFAWNLNMTLRRVTPFDEAAFAEIVKLLLPLEQVEDNQWLFLSMVRDKRWIAAQAFLDGGIRPTAYMREEILREGRLKGPDLERALTLLGQDPHTAP